MQVYKIAAIFKRRDKRKTRAWYVFKRTTRPLSGFINQWVGTRPKKSAVYVYVCAVL